MKNKVFFNNSKSNKISGVLSTPRQNKDEKGLIAIISNGFPSSKDGSTYIEIEKILNKLSVSTLRYDYSGLGESEGTMEEFNINKSVDDLESAVNYLHKNGFDQIALLGFSYGGIVSIVYAAQTGMSSNLKFLVLVSPVSNYKEQREMTGEVKYDKKWKKDGFVIEEDRQGNIYRIPFLFYEELAKIEGIELASNIVCPTLVIHGSADEDIPVEQSIEIAKEMPNATLEIINGGNHHSSGPVASKKKLDLIVGFVSNYILQEMS